MAESAQKRLKMKNGNEETLFANESQAAQAGETENGDSNIIGQNELETGGWSVVSFEGVAMSNLSYDEARKWLNKLNEQKISGLCIVTNEAAARATEDGDVGEK